MTARELLDDYDRLTAERDRAAREYHRAEKARMEARDKIIALAGGSGWECSVELNETAPAQRAADCGLVETTCRPAEAVRD
jgi:CRISPR/Cas system-associated protein Csm6